MTRVLMVIYGFGYGGIRACIQNYVTYMNRTEFHIDIYVYGADSSPFRQQMEGMGCKMYFDPDNDIATNHILTFVRKLTNFIRKGHYDVVHAHCNLISAWVTLAAMMGGAKVRIAHSHSTSHFSGRFLQNLWSYLRRGIISLTATHKLACGQLAGETMYGEKTAFIILQNGINVNRFLKCDKAKVWQLREKLNIPEGARVYANVTRMDPQKNHLFAIEIFREIHRIDPTAVFIYGGVTPPMNSTVEQVKAKIEEYGLQPWTRYVGAFMDIQNLYHLSDLWIYCSAYEGLPFGPIELQAASVPTLASDVITSEMDLGLGLIHFLSLNDSPVKWAQKACEIVKPSIDERTIKAAFVSHHFDIQQNILALEAIYRGKEKRTSLVKSKKWNQ